MSSICSDAHATGTGTQRRLTAQSRCAWHTGATANHKNVAIIAFVGRATPRRQTALQAVIIESPEFSQTTLATFERNPEVRENELSAAVSSIAQKETGFEAYKSHGQVRPYCETHYRT